MTRLRYRVLHALETRGEMPGLALANAFASPGVGRAEPFDRRQAAIRWSIGYMQPLVKIGWVKRRGRRQGGIYCITPEGVHTRTCAQQQFQFHEIMKA